LNDRTSEVPTSPADSFEPHRPLLTGLAYRMLGSIAEAEDAVQEAYLRWHDVERSQVNNPRAFLCRTVTRLCLDHLKSARVRREQYVGPWLPEPLVADAPSADDAADELAADVSMALMVALQRLSPLERAAFLLHDVFNVDFKSIADALGRDQAACRQLASRAREHVRAARPRFKPSPAEVERLVGAFMQAVGSKDVNALTQLLREDAVMHSDGGGKVAAAVNPIYGRDKIIRFLLAKIPPPSELRVRRVLINGTPGLVVDQMGRRDVISFDVQDGMLTGIFVVCNPDKLQHIK
jgi:RNA polymerase sigma-70 factor (ECF subfamily)